MESDALTRRVLEILMAQGVIPPPKPEKTIEQDISDRLFGGFVVEFIPFFFFLGLMILSITGVTPLSPSFLIEVLFLTVASCVSSCFMLSMGFLADAKTDFTDLAVAMRNFSLYCFVGTIFCSLYDPYSLLLAIVSFVTVSISCKNEDTAARLKIRLGVKRE